MALLSGIRQPTAAETGERTPKLAGAAWALLILNTLGSTGAQTVIPLPRAVSQLVTMGALMLAFVIALALNPRLKLRPSAYLLLLTLLLVTSTVASLHLEAGFGSLFRCFRFAVFIATLWLLTRWWNGSFTFVRHHIRMFYAVLVSVAIGLVIAPGKAMPDVYGGRLSGAVWPLTPPQVGQYAAVIAGLAALLWLGKRTTAVSALVIIVPSLGLLLLTHTRTATLGLVAGLVVALLSLAATNARARKVFTTFVLVAGFAAVALAGLLQAWFLRGQSEENFSSLTGRAKVWDALLAAPRTVNEYIFGVGLTDKSYDGLPIDNSWLAVYHEQGFTGIAIVAAFLLVLVAVAVLRPPSLARACAIFLITYCISASYTEAGLGDASPYLLHLALAASLLAQGTVGAASAEDEFIPKGQPV
ncbi:O-antigen ligase family protein [Amycolatopsis sp. NPDC051903]|uniref:O-antigen ligase family protein n=1 Tax=Amycolatopsis sp. NPDC051903 TaxID=3363936 RepID=UPI0037B318F0